MKAFARAAVALGILAAGAARAEVADLQPHGFKVRHTAEVAASPEQVWAALIRPSAWWHPDHNWSGSQKNLTLDPVAGGCFCERWSGGQAMHMLVTQAVPNEKLHLWGPLGPLQMEGASGGLTVTLKQNGQGTTVTLAYSVGGYLSGGAATWAPLVDGVLGVQLARLERLAETGAPGQPAAASSGGS